MWEKNSKNCYYSDLETSRGWVMDYLDGNLRN